VRNDHRWKINTCFLARIQNYLERFNIDAQESLQIKMYKQHIKAGVKRVIISGPTKGYHIVLGVNDELLSSNDIISNASLRPTMQHQCLKF
jgi:hypothetical protein